MEKIFNLLKNKDVPITNLKKFSFFIVGVVIISLILIFNPLFSKLGPIIIAIFFIFSISLIWIMAGYVVFKSLLTASIGLTFIIFIGQSYCAPNVVHSANDSLKIIIGFGFLYVVINFLQNLYKELFGDKNLKEELKNMGIIAILKKANKNKHSWSTLIIYALFISLFIWQIYRVINPIFNSLCIY